MTYEILFLDIDGTILKPDHTYDPSTKLAIHSAKAHGLKVFIATGRPLHEIRGLAAELEIDAFISYNGAYALFQEQVLFHQPFKEETIKNYLSLTAEHDGNLVLYTDRSNHYTSLEAPRVQNFIRILQMKENALIKEDTPAHTLGATLLGIASEDLSYYDIEPGIHLSQVNVEGAKDCYDLIRSSVNKGVAVEAVLKHLGISKEKAIAFGDGMNDKEMLRAVGHGFAMANANPDLFQYAKYRTTAVDDNGIYNGLYHLGLI